MDTITVSEERGHEFKESREGCVDAWKRSGGGKGRENGVIKL